MTILRPVAEPRRNSRSVAGPDCDAIGTRQPSCRVCACTCGHAERANVLKALREMLVRCEKQHPRAVSNITNTRSDVLTRDGARIIPNGRPVATTPRMKIKATFIAV